MAKIIFYRKADSSILSYVEYGLEKDENGVVTNPPSVAKCAETHGLTEADIGVKEWTKVDPVEADYADNIADLLSTELVDIV